ncbi:MAG: hypothetical protein ACMXYD_01945 [Candidatus Woesearchaeota archaeon]
MSELPSDHKIHPHHPEHPDNHPLRKHHEHHPLVLRMTGVFLLTIIFFACLLGILTNAPFGVVLLSFAASFVFALAVLALAHSDHLSNEYLVSALLILVIVFSVIIFLVSPQTDVLAVMSLNLLLSGIFLLLLQQSYAHHEQEVVLGVVTETKPEQRDLASLFIDIQERAKRINIAVGRTYSVYKEASPAMRNKIKIPNQLYNELRADKKTPFLQAHLEQIAARLALLQEQEQEVFTPAEYKRLNRKKSFPVLEVLADNEGEGILQVHASAVAYVQTAINHLEN